MYKSKQISVGFMSAFALIALQGCDETSAPVEEPSIFEHCVDEDGIVADDVHCDPTAVDAGAVDTQDAGSTSSTPTSPRVHYHWWYGGVTPVGGHVSGGSVTRPVAVSGGVPRATVVRGGFGTPGGVRGGGIGS